MEIKNISLSKIINDAAFNGQKLQAPDGSFPAGHNGPYNDPETPVRNTAHWLFFFSSDKITSVSFQNRKEIALNALRFLRSEFARPYQKAFLCRNKKGKDKVNGLIGHAWVIEALIAAGNSFDIQEAIDLAIEIYFLHPFNFDKHYWLCIDLKGNPTKPDYTFNHQLWFAASGSQLGDSDAYIRSNLFLNNIKNNLQTYNDGIIFHGSKISREKLSNMEDLRRKSYRIRVRKKLYAKSIGYHGFNLYALAILKKLHPGHSIWNSSVIKKILKPLFSFNNELNKIAVYNKYGLHYNPIGIENAYASEVFGLGKRISNQWLQLQFEESFNKVDGSLLTKNSDDFNTSSARIYEATRLDKNYTFTLS